MAGDWIKMRLTLVAHPRVMRMAEFLLDSGAFLDWSGLAYGIGGYPAPSQEEEAKERHAALRVTRYVTVTALLRFWGYANEHAKENETIAGLWPHDVDEIAGVPSFSAALEHVEWIRFDRKSNCAHLPNFSEHNVIAGQRSPAAERQKRYREKQKEAVNSDVTRDVTVTRREEEIREDNKREEKALSGKPSLKTLTALGIDEQHAKDWLAVRKAKRAPLTDTVIQNMQSQAEKAGISLAKAVEICAKKSWQGFNADWDWCDDKPQKVNGGGAWWASDSSIEAKARELGMWPPRSGESWQQLKGRIQARIDNGTAGLSL